MEYKIIFKHKNAWFWKKIFVTGNSYQKELDKMILFKKDGSIYEIPEWSNYFVKLGPDFLIAQKKQIEKETGVDVKLNI